MRPPLSEVIWPGESWSPLGVACCRRGPLIRLVPAWARLAHGWASVQQSPGPFRVILVGRGPSSVRSTLPGPYLSRATLHFFIWFFNNFSRVFRLFFRVVVGPSRWPWPATRLFAWSPQPGRRPDRHPKASVRHCSLPGRAQSGFNGASATQAGASPCRSAVRGPRSAHWAGVSHEGCNPSLSPRANS